MCGIAGIVSRDGNSPDRALLDPMLREIRHRGPDASGSWSDGPVAFGHQRLTIIDLTTDAGQPMVTACGEGVLVYNGEVYNYPELRQELEAEGCHFASSGDTEVVLQALFQWGPEGAIPRLNGMFALAYYDRRDETVWLARDRMGIKSLVVTEVGSELVFASEVKSLLQHPSVKKQLDKRELANHLLGRGRESHAYLFEGVEGVEAGHWWKITPETVERGRYYHLLDKVDVERILKAGNARPADFIRGLDDRLRASVRKHLASDVPLAVMISGGVDSGLTAYYASESISDLQAYVADVPGSEGEGDQAALVARHLGIPIERVVIDQEDYLRLWPETVWHGDGMSYHNSDPALLAVTRKCRADGVKVLLTGEGADELFGGYDWHRKTFDHWRRKKGFFKKLINRPFSKRVEDNLTYFPFSARSGGDVQSGNLFRYRLIAGLAAEAELRPSRFMKLLGKVEPPEDRAFIAYGYNDMYEHLSWILHRHDRMGMAASMEMRVPFLENDMFDFALHLPRKAKLHKGTSKWVVKKMAEQYLPKEVIYARKKGFPVPDSFTSGTSGLLQGGMLADCLGWSAESTQEICAIAKRKGPLRYHLVGLEMWLQIFFGGVRIDGMVEKLLRFSRV